MDSEQPLHEPESYFEALKRDLERTSFEAKDKPNPYDKPNMLTGTPPTPSASRAGRDMLIGQLSDITNNVESLIVERIEALITRLQGLREMTILENRAALDKFSRFIEAIDEGLQETKKLEDLAGRLERR